MKLFIQIEKPSLNYEDIYIQYSYNSQSYSLLTRDLTSCSGSIVTVTLNSVSSLFIKVKRLSSSSSYKITVNSSNSSSESSTQNNWYIMIGVGGMIFIFSIIAIFVVSFWIWRHKRNQKNRESPVKHEEREKWIKDTLNNMTTCEFQYWESKYKQDSCTIWLESFIHDAIIHKTNEWDHIFHSACLQKWYWNIKLGLKLVCPCWSTENTPFSKQERNNESVSIGSIQVEISASKFDTMHNAYSTQQNLFESNKNNQTEAQWCE